MILSCGCRSEHEGIFCEWDAFSKECEDAVAYGCVCAQCYLELNARPTEKEQQK
jgi:hypothetical protein